MITHIFMGQAQEGVAVEELDELVDAWRSLQELVPDLRSIRAGVNVSPRERTWSVALVAEFDDLDGWERYMEHPEHKAVAARLTSRLIRPEGKAAVQFVGSADA